MGDYYIGIDRDGQPYIAHASWNGARNAVRKHYKYIKKIVDGAKVRYFYTKEELQAYYDSLKNKAEEVKDKAEEVKDKASKGVQFAKDRMKEEFGGEKRREEYQKAVDNYVKDPTKENEKLLDNSYNKWRYTMDAKENKNSVLSPDAAKQKVINDTIKQCDSIKSTAVDAVNRRVRLDDGSYAELDSPEAKERSKKASSLMHELNEKRSLLDKMSQYGASRYPLASVSSIKSSIEGIEKELKDIENKNIEEYKKEEEIRRKAIPKDYITLDDLQDTYRREGGQGYKQIADNLKDRGVEYNDVGVLNEPMDEEYIIDHLGGGDETKGSCASLAFAYIGNKAGYSVTDFRDGESRNVFSDWNTTLNIADLPGVDSKVIKSKYNSSPSKDAMSLLNSMEDGKEYYLACGQHAAIVRKNSGKYEYLELQSGRKGGNTWKSLNETTLNMRFLCPSSVRYGNSAVESYYRSSNSSPYMSCLIDAESLGKSKQFTSLLGYINTPVGQQKKGKYGHEK